MKGKLHFTLLLLLCWAPGLMAQRANDHIRRGNELYENGKFEEAEIEYRKALEKDPQAWKARYNLSNSLYRQKRYKEAGMALDSLTENITDPQLKSQFYHNLGNSRLEEKDYRGSVEAYKEALKHDPKAEDTRYNLSYALKKLQQQQQQQQKKQQQQQQQQQQQPQQNQAQKPEKPEKQEQKPQRQQLNRDEAEQMLDALNRAEKELRKKTDKRDGKEGVAASGKNW